MDRSLKLVNHTHPSLQYQISNDDYKSLLEYYYKMSHCVVALKQSNYVYDLHGTDVLRKTIKRLPSIFHYRWTKHFKIRRHKEPSLTDLESPLQERILASKEASYHDPKKKRNTGSDEKWFGKTTLSKPTCIMCEENPLFYKCESYKAMIRKEKMRFVKRQNLCFNCLKGDHRAEKCPSKNRCHHPECAETHHRFLCDYFKKKVEETAMEDAKVYMSKLPQVQNIYRLRLSK